MTATDRNQFDPSVIQIAPSITVGDLKTREELVKALAILEHDIAEIKAQLENPPEHFTLDWRQRAESARRVKIHAMNAIRTKLSEIRAANRTGNPAAAARTIASDDDLSEVLALAVESLTGIDRYLRGEIEQWRRFGRDLDDDGKGETINFRIDEETNLDTMLELLATVRRSLAAYAADPGRPAP